MVVEPAVAANQAVQFFRRQDRAAVDQHEMQADMQRFEAVRPVDGVRHGRRRHHQAGGRQDAVAVRSLDRFVDRDVAPEIVGSDDQPPRRQPQLGISRWRRNWKNSTPSRNRRRIISGLLSISPSSEAIFRRRK
jgi:hypothetical protein